VAASRRLSQRISEGDGIAIIVLVDDADAARAAEEQGAKAVALETAIAGIRDATSLPLLWLGRGAPTDADALAVRPDGNGDAEVEPELETVADVRDEDELARVLERLDPEIFLIAPHSEDEQADPLEPVLELLPDVPAGKLAIAAVDVASREEVEALERAGFDAVLVTAGRVSGLVGSPVPDV
jgi:hypothetical protein